MVLEAEATSSWKMEALMQEVQGISTNRGLFWSDEPYATVFVFDLGVSIIDFKGCAFSLNTDVAISNEVGIRGNYKPAMTCASRLAPPSSSPP